MIEQLAQQLAQLARQARQAARYREIGENLRRSEGMLLYRRWREADEARRGQDALRAHTTAAAQYARGTRPPRRQAIAEAAEEALPPLREEDAIAGAVVQRLMVEQTALTDQEARAAETIDTLTARIAQLARDIDRERR